MKNVINKKNENQFEDIYEFVDHMPNKLKLEMYAIIYNKDYRQLNILNDKSRSFIAWICPLFKANSVTDNSYVYFEGDEI